MTPPSRSSLERSSFILVKPTQMPATLQRRTTSPKQDISPVTLSLSQLFCRKIENKTRPGNKRPSKAAISIPDFPSFIEAMEAVETLRRYFITRGLDDQVVDACEKRTREIGSRE